MGERTHAICHHLLYRSFRKPCRSKMGDRTWEMRSAIVSGCVMHRLVNSEMRLRMLCPVCIQFQHLLIYIPETLAFLFLLHLACLSYQASILWTGSSCNFASFFPCCETGTVEWGERHHIIYVNQFFDGLFRKPCRRGMANGSCEVTYSVVSRRMLGRLVNDAMNIGLGVEGIISHSNT